MNNSQKIKRSVSRILEAGEGSEKDAGGAHKMSVAEKSSTLAAQAVWPIDRVKDHAVKIGSGVTPSGGSAGYLDAGVPLSEQTGIVCFLNEQTRRTSGLSKTIETQIATLTTYRKSLIYECVTASGGSRTRTCKR